MGRSGTMTVLFTDIVGSTELLTRLGERAWDDVRREHFSVLRTALAEHDGTEVKNTGDGIMAVFGSVVDGVNCAVLMQQRTAHIDAGGLPVGLRIGLSTGEALRDRGDWFGTPVVEAARLCALAAPDETWATAVVRSLAGSETDATFVAMGAKELKGFDQTVDVFALEPRRDQHRTLFGRVEQHVELGDRLVAQLDYWESLPSLHRARAAATAAISPLAGDVICEIGAGAGTELARIARMVGPSGRVIGIDPSAPMLEECARRADAEGVTVELVPRDGRDTGLPADLCDAVRIERVVQHVGDLDGLLAEAIRITKPGGRIVIADSDWGSLMVHPGDRELLHRTKRAFEQHVLPEPWAGRMLHAALLDHGLLEVEHTMFAIEADGGLIPTLTTMYGRFVEARLVTAEAVDEHLAELEAAFDRGTGVFAFCMFVASGRVP